MKKSRQGKKSTVTTAEFKRYFQNYFAAKVQQLEKINWDDWLYKPGMPTVNMMELFDQTLYQNIKNLVEKWSKYDGKDANSEILMSGLNENEM